MSVASHPVVDDARVAARHRTVLVGILLATFVLYAPSLTNGFTWDDRHAAMGSGPTRHPLVATLHSPAAYFASNWWPQHAPAATAYRPATTLWFALRHACVGDHAGIAHLLNVALHTLATGLVFVLLRRVALPFGAAAAGAAVFGLHALHAEAVANLVGAAELLAIVFGLASTLALGRAMAAERGAAFARWLVVAAACWFLAASSKENGLAWLVLAPAFVLAQHARGVRVRCTRLRAGGVALAAAAVASAWSNLRAGMLANLPGGSDASVGMLENPLLALPPAERAASGMLTWGHGLAQVLLPRGLCCDHGPSQLPVVHDLVSWPAAAAAALTLLFAGALAVSACTARRRPLAALAVVVFVASSFALTNVAIPVFMQFAERNWMAPTVALAVGVAAGAARLRDVRVRRVAAGALAAWLAWSVATTLPRTTVWADDATLVQREVASSPRSVRMQLCAGVMSARHGDVAAAHAHFAAAAELAPELPQPWLELSRLESLRGEHAQARAHLGRAERSHPAEVARCRGMLRALRRSLDAASHSAAAAPR